MGREIRMVPPGWEHPRDAKGNYEPLMKGPFSKRLADWKEGFVRFEEWPEGTATMLCMYEDTSEGTPISPAFETPEKLARWLADNKASAFGGMTATYEQWLATCREGYSVGMVMAGGRMMSGVEFNQQESQS